MPITIEEPIVKAVNETFDTYWLRTLVIKADPPAPGMAPEGGEIRLHLVPMSSATGAVNGAHKVTAAFWDIVQNVPEAAAAVDAVLAAVPKMQAYLQAKAEAELEDAI